MSKPIPLREYVAGGLVDEATVNALLRFGEPMLSALVEERADGRAPIVSYRAWIRFRSGGRTFADGHDTAPQLAAERLLRRLG